MSFWSGAGNRIRALFRVSILPGFTPIRVEEFRGLATLFKPQDCPAIFSPVCRNNAYLRGSVSQRPGTVTKFDLGGGTDIYHAELLVDPFTTDKFYFVLMEDHLLYWWEGSGSRHLLTLSSGSIPATTVMFKTMPYQGLGGFVAFSDGFAGTTAPYVIFLEPARASLAGLTIFNAADGQTVTIGSITYTFRNAISVAYDVLIGASTNDSFVNLANAINGNPGEGVIYGNGTLSHPQVRATAPAYVVMPVYAIDPTVDGTTIPVSTTIIGFWEKPDLTGPVTSLVGGDEMTADLMTVPPVAIGSMAATEGLLAGGFSAGTHKVVVGPITRTGYYGRPTESVNLVISVDGKSADLNGVPTWPQTEVIDRYIAITQADLDVFYLVGNIGDNVGSGIHLDGVTDEQLGLQTDISVWFTYQSPLPGAMGMLIYHNRLITWGDGANSSIAKISQAGSPQSFREDIGFQEVRPSDSQRLVTAFVIRDTLYYVKQRSLHGTQDSGGEINTWALSLVAEDIGTESINGVDTAGDGSFAVIMDNKGLYFFAGGAPNKIGADQNGATLIDPTWQTINFAAMDTAEVHIDASNNLIYCLVPLGNATRPDHVIVADYKEGWSKIKWDIWSTDGPEWRSIIIDNSQPGGHEVVIAAASPIVRSLDENATSDNGTAINRLYRTGLVEPGFDGLNLYGGIGGHATGSGNLSLKVYGPDGTLIATPSTVALSSAPNADFFKRLNFRTERVFLEFSQNDADSQATINRLVAYAKPDGVRAY